MLDIKTIVKNVSSKFIYLSDKKTIIGDFWYIMKEKNNTLSGDCEDFALTCIYELCNRNILLFILNVFILHRYRLYLTITKKDERHIVGYANGYYFDNFSYEALDKETFIQETGHKFKYFYLSPWIMFYMFLGLFFRTFKI